MVTLTTGNLLDADAEALINTVNTVGVMGKGIALQFKRAFPGNFRAYADAVKAEEVEPGRMFVYDRSQEAGALFDNPRYIINFPTKRHWKSQSRMEDIEAGLDALVETVRRLQITSIAVPPLGCGNGGLDWDEVRPRIERALESIPGLTVLLFEPVGAPRAEEMVVRTETPKMTRGRALVIRLLDLYRRADDYKMGRLEAQKLAYFFEVAAGGSLNLRFGRHKFGPYSDALNHVLQAIDGHYIRGYGDGNVKSELSLVPGALDEATTFLQAEPDAEAVERQLQAVERTIEGFETPYGMELLGTVLWLVRDDAVPVADVGQAVEAAQAWSPRKKRLMRPDHIEIAWDRLAAQGWTPRADYA